MELRVKEKFKTYPADISSLLMQIRSLIYDVAEQDNIANLEEALKWGEPSYIAKTGSTIRFDWKAKAPDQYCIYFNCKTQYIFDF